MILPSNREVQHKTQLLRLLRTILSDSELTPKIAFKGGTYAALRGILNRFSVDLDFDLIDKSDKEFVLKKCIQIIDELGLEIKDQSKNHIQFFLKYDAKEGERNTLKLEINDDTSPYNEYEMTNLNEINLLCKGHTLDTMFSNKLFDATARFEKNGKIAGRDFFDIHQFFYQGLPIKKEIIEERSGVTYKEYFIKLKNFIEKEVNNQLLMQDLNPLLKPEVIKRTLPHLKDEILMYLNTEIEK